MGAEVAVKSGVGTLVLDARREGTVEMKGYTFPALVTSQNLIDKDPHAARAAIKAVQSAQKALKEDPSRATAIGRKLFPPAEAGMIAELIRRDLPFYDSLISEQNVAAMNQFARSFGLLSKPVPYMEVVWTG
jgi:ABC-type nitrate/sulfonate/bicarbonate transport system substrate-binding protein